ncbi:MAG: molybdate ABC transporter substrate-binding protein [Polyangiales bacterium]
MRTRAPTVSVLALSQVSLLCLTLLLVSGCPCDPRQSSRLHVFAASSLTEAFQELEGAFEGANEDAEVSLAFGGSQVLRLQIEQGAPADVFASADESHMDALVRMGRVQASKVFAHSELAVIVPLDNPAKIESFADLPRAHRLVLGVPTVPVGRYSRELLQRASESFGPDFTSQVLAHVVSEESNVRLVRAKVELGEADAAIVYRTDVTPSSRIRVVPIPAVLNVRTDYFIGIVQESPHMELARRWIAYLQSEEGQHILAKHGFLSE